MNHKEGKNGKFLWEIMMRNERKRKGNTDLEEERGNGPWS